MRPKLTRDAVAKISTPASGQKKIFDGNGLFMLVKHSGSRGWRFKYVFAGREQLLSLGAYPDVTLETARGLADAARAQIRAGINPSTARKEHIATVRDAAEQTFGRVGLEYLALHDDKSERTRAKHKWTFGLLNRLHTVAMTDLRTPQIVQVLKAIETIGDRRETAHRCAQLVGRICRYAVQHGHITASPATELRGVLKPVRTESLAALTDPHMLGVLLYAINKYGGHGSVASALRLAPYVFVRPGELRTAEWSEIDLDKGEWLLPAQKMKMRRAHLVPLARQAVEILRTQHVLSGHKRFVFPSPRSGRPLSDMALAVAMHSLLIVDSSVHTIHGFRSTASTLLNERGYDSAVVELQLGHAKRDRVAAVYDRAQRLPERRKMMQEWADYLDSLRDAP